MSCAAEVDRRLAAWTGHLGADRTAYRHHVLRVLAICDALHARSPRRETTPPPSTAEEFLTAAAFHDLGIWSAGTFDYLAPSVDLARAWLTDHHREDLGPLVDSMIGEHHKLRCAGAPASAVEMFRRADTIDVSLGLVRFGIPWPQYRAILRQWPDAGFHRRLVVLTLGRVRRHPTSPLPMFKW